MMFDRGNDVSTEFASTLYDDSTLLATLRYGPTEELQSEIEVRKVGDSYLFLGTCGEAYGDVKLVSHDDEEKTRYHLDRGISRIQGFNDHTDDENPTVWRITIHEQDEHFTDVSSVTSYDYTEGLPEEDDAPEAMAA